MRRSWPLAKKSEGVGRINGMNGKFVGAKQRDLQLPESTFCRGSTVSLEGRWQKCRRRYGLSEHIRVDGASLSPVSSWFV